MSTIVLNAAALVAAKQLLTADASATFEMLKDTSIPLDERWDALTQLVENHVLVSEDGCGDGFIDTLGDNMTLYDDFNMDRYETRTYPEMYSHIMEAEGEYQQHLVDARESGRVDQWREKVLASGRSGFQNDW